MDSPLLVQNTIYLLPPPVLAAASPIVHTLIYAAIKLFMASHETINTSSRSHLAVCLHLRLSPLMVVTNDEITRRWRSASRSNVQHCLHV